MCSEWKNDKMSKKIIFYYLRMGNKMSEQEIKKRKKNILL